jgi:two-component system, chemotaxis family, protein-glutamate methylesterase/glutaminase
VAASAGGVEALTALARGLPADLDAAVLVVLHLPAWGVSTLGELLDRAGPLPAATARDGEPLRPGVIRVAPPDRHLLVQDGVIRLSAGPKENGHRPAADPLLRSLAAHRARAVGVVLSGARDDGTQGLARIKATGGTALVQSPEEAAFPGMVRSAMAHVEVDGVLPIAGLAARLTQLAEERSAMPAEREDPQPRPPWADRESTRYTCPECGGHLELQTGEPVPRYVCMVGHAYSEAAFDENQGNAVEAALWTSMRLLGDRASLLEQMADRADGRGLASSAHRYRHRAAEAQAAQETLNGLLESGRLSTAREEEDPSL